MVQFYTNRYHKAMEALNVLPPSIEPHASGHIIEQIEYIKRILDDGYAYESDGSVYFDVLKYNRDYHYGKLSGRNVEELLNTTRALDGQSEKETHATSRFGKKPRRNTSCAGHRLGATASPDGISNAPQWGKNIWVKYSTSMAAGWT